MAFSNTTSPSAETMLIFISETPSLLGENSTKLMAPPTSPPSEEAFSMSPAAIESLEEFAFPPAEFPCAAFME